MSTTEKAAELTWNKIYGTARRPWKQLEEATRKEWLTVFETYDTMLSTVIRETAVETTNT